jgi:two-component system, cell cycle sensor histidine kinase and response regulator CckA
MADATQMRQVVMNMITNGSDAIGEQEGTVTVRTACFEAASTCLENYSSFWGDRPEGRYACLEVSDDGCGMDAETLARIFDPFFTTKFTGRGLGLAAVQGILRGHKGAIQVTSQPGRGTTFKVLLPACESGQTNLACQDEVLRLTGGGRIILVVDDEELVRAVARSALEVAGFQVLLASDGREGVEVFRTQCDRIAAVLLDWTMPQLGGADTFQEMRRLRPDARVILCSGFSEQEVTNRLAGKGLDGFLQKPFRVSQLITTVQQVLCGSPSACRSGIENASADDGQKEEDDYAVTH